MNTPLRRSPTSAVRGTTLTDLDSSPGQLRLANAIEPHPEARPQGSSPRGPMPARPGGIEPLLGIDELAWLLNCSRRLIERLRASGRIPPADLRIGKMPRWKRSTIDQWIDEAASRGGGRDHTPHG